MYRRWQPIIGRSSAVQQTTAFFCTLKIEVGDEGDRDEISNRHRRANGRLRHHSSEERLRQSHHDSALQFFGDDVEFKYLSTRRGLNINLICQQLPSISALVPNRHYAAAFPIPHTSHRTGDNKKICKILLIFYFQLRLKMIPCTETLIYL